MKEALLIFAKNPDLGKVKTRLAATIGDAHTLLIYQKLLAHTFSITKDLKVDKIVFYSDRMNESGVWENKIFQKKLQHGNDLGERMKNAFKSLSAAAAGSFTAGYQKVIIIGTDCFELNSSIILKAFLQLENADVVIGPATDGGYYLIGMKKLYEGIFENISWSTSQVLNQTISFCKKMELSFFLLDELSDIDNESDLKKYPELFFMKNKKL